MEIRKCAGQENWKDLKESLDRLAIDIASREQSPVGISVAAGYYELTEQLESAEEAYERLANLGSSRSRLACLWYPRNQAEALALLTKPRDAKSEHSREVGLEEDITRCLLLAFETGSLPDGEDWDKLAARFKDTVYAIDLLQVAMALKLEQEVTELAKSIKSAGTFKSFEISKDTAFYATRLDHLAEERPADELVPLADNRRATGEAYFQTALRYWARADEQQARKYLQLTYEYGNYWDNEFHWARALLSRFDAFGSRQQLP